MVVISDVCINAPLASMRLRICISRGQPIRLSVDYHQRRSSKKVANTTKGLDCRVTSVSAADPWRCLYERGEQPAPCIFKAFSLAPEASSSCEPLYTKRLHAFLANSGSSGPSSIFQRLVSRAPESNYARANHVLQMHSRLRTQQTLSDEGYNAACFHRKAPEQGPLIEKWHQMRGVLGANTVIVARKTREEKFILPIKEYYRSA